MASNANAVLAAGVRDGIAQYGDSTDGWGMLGVVRDGIAQYWTVRMDGAWHLVVVAVVDWFYLIVIDDDVKPSQSAGTGDRAGCAACSGWWCAMASRNTGTARTDWAWHLVVVAVAAVFSMNYLSGLIASF